MGLLVTFTLINRNTIKIVENSTKLETSRITPAASQPKKKQNIWLPDGRLLGSFDLWPSTFDKFSVGLQSSGTSLVQNY